MVTTRWHLASAAVCALVLTAGCSSQTNRSPSDDLSAPTDSGSTPTRDVAVSTLPHPGRPDNACIGATSYADVLDLVTGGRATLFVRATVTGDATKDGPNSKNVPVGDVAVLAGNDADGTPDKISETELEQYNDLPPGTYLMLLSHSRGSGSTYDLAYGLPGSFTIEGDYAFERCANEADPSSPIRAAQGANIVDLVSNVQKAFDATSFGPEPTVYPQPSVSN